MNRIDRQRRKIESIDKKLKKMFLKRMHASHEMKLIKDDLGLEYYDKAREELMISKYSCSMKEYQEEYKEFLKDILKISKDVMKK